MIDVSFSNGSRPGCVLFIGAHCDDIEIGCGGTILSLLQQSPQTRVVFVTLSSTDAREAESRAAAEMFLEGGSNHVVEIKSFRESYFPYIASEIKPFFEDVKSRHRPDLIFTHRKDAHQDHNLVNALTWNTFRDELILEYEVMQYDGELGSPNLFVPLTREQLRRKTDILNRAFVSQLSRQWFTDDTFTGLARLRGVECNAPEGVAEAFHCRKVRLNFANLVGST